MNADQVKLHKRAMAARHRDQERKRQALAQRGPGLQVLVDQLYELARRAIILDRTQEFVAFCTAAFMVSEYAREDPES